MSLAVPKPAFGNSVDNKLGLSVVHRVPALEGGQLRGLIHRKLYDVVPPKVEYGLTELGRGLQPVLQAIVEWGLTGAHEEILGMNAKTRD